MPTRDFVRICLFASLIAALGFLPKLDLPIAAGVPVTAQTLGVMLAGLLLGPRNALLAVALFLFVVALGMPFLSGGRGGLAVFAGPAGGFLFGWLAGAWLTGWIMWHPPSRSILVNALVAAFAGGIVAIYAVGIPWLAFVANLSLAKAALAATVFVPGDVLKVVAAGLVVRSLPQPVPSTR